jgi:glyoxylase-like metal-dependent hydrolase (beta-lactamase superfamily II)
MEIKAFFDQPTNTLTYVVWEPKTRDAVIIDPVLNFDPLAWQTSTEGVDELVSYVRDNRLRVHYVLETHAHADHLTGAQLLKSILHTPVVIGERIKEVQRTFKLVFDLPEGFSVSGDQFDKLVADGEQLRAGSLSVHVIATPGHTPACVTYKIGDAIFTGDSLFMDDYGTGRADFPNGSSSALYESIHDRLYALPDATRVFVGHDYLPNGRALRYETTIGKSKAENPMLRQTTSKAEFVAVRDSRDAGLAPPALIYQSLQVNANGGQLPEPHTNGVRYMNIPVNRRRPTTAAGAPVQTKTAAE